VSHALELRPHVRACKDEDRLVGGQKDLVSREAERGRVEGWPLPDQFLHPRQVATLQGNDHRHFFCAVGLLGRKGGKQIRELAQKTGSKQCDLNWWSALPLEDQRGPPIQLLLRAAPDLHLFKLGVRDTQLGATFSGGALE
jgi:hypothetical protein